MALYELRTYTLHVGKMAEAVKLYQELGFPALRAAVMIRSSSVTSRPTRAPSISSFICGSSMMTPTVARTGRVFANRDFVEGFASKFRPLVMTQEVKLLPPAPWGPHP